MQSSVLLIGFWTGFQDSIATGLTKAELPAEIAADLSDGRLGLLLNDIKNLATGNIRKAGLWERRSKTGSASRAAGSPAAGSTACASESLLGVAVLSRLRFEGEGMAC